MSCRHDIPGMTGTLCGRPWSAYRIDYLLPHGVVISFTWYEFAAYQAASRYRITGFPGPWYE
jgi:hypothetical protein